MTILLYHVDAFAERPFGGNPAAVCVLSDEMDDAFLQHVAGELNLSETAFLMREGSAWRLRWFTPTVEVDLCGHATLASAHALWESGREALEARIDFETRSGRLSAARRGAAIELDFPAEPADACDLPPDLLAALGAAGAKWTGRNRLDWVVELASERDVVSLRPEFPRLARAGGPARGVIVTAASERPGVDFVSRYFAPAAGIDEDPVTGSAHCCLGPLWSARLGRAELVGHQVSARGGIVGVRTAGSRVALSGRAVTVTRGELLAERGSRTADR